MAAIALLVMIVAVPVFAETEVPETTVPADSSFSPGQLPNAADVAKGLVELEREEVEEQVALETPVAESERADSQQAFADLDPEEARHLFMAEFAAQLQALNTDPARFLSDAQLQQTLEDGTVARVTDEGEPAILDAGIPVQTEDDNGTLQKVDLTIVDGAEGLEPANPLTDLTLPLRATESVEVGDQGLSITPLGIDSASKAEPLGEKALFYPSVEVDTDLVIAPLAYGVEIFNQLRSSDSPHTLRFEIGMPPGAELQSDDMGGAEVISGETVLGRVPFPTAVDAQGADVPVELSIEGSEIALSLSTADADLAYPVSVDPSLVEDWYNASWYNGQNLQALSDGSWAYNPGASWIYGSTSCIWSCWGSGRGLFVSAESGWHGGNQFGQWAYGPPGGTSYISSAWINPFWRNNYANCPKSSYPQPHDYDGLWSPTYGWWPLETNRANDYGYATPSGWGKALVIGLGNAEVGAENKCRRDIMAGGVAIWIGDPEPPSWNSSPSVADQWIDKSSIPVSASANDPGLGMKYFNLWTTDSNGVNQTLVGNAVHSCSGLRANPCPASWASTITNYNPAGLPTGINKMNTVAYDALGIEHNSAAGPVFLKVDHAAPTISFSGELLTEKPVKFHLDVTAKDGNAGSLATAQSGMKSLEFFVDGQLAGRFPETPNPPACVKVQEGRNVGSCEFVNVGVDLNRSLTGKHVIKVVAKDSLDHPTEKSLEVNLPPDTIAPQVTPSGALFTAANGWIKAGTSSLTVEATDAETGVVEESVLVDNTQAATPFTQECFYGGCSLTRAFTPSLAGYSEGAHTVKAKAKDGKGNYGEASWTVKVDVNSPTLTSISAPAVPAGWTPQLGSFNLNYAATDAGVGIKKVEVSRPTPAGTTLKSNAYSSTCNGAAASPCLGSVEGTSPAISTASMAEGTDTVSVKAYDAFERVSAEKTLKVNVDRSNPVVTATGPLMNAGTSTLVGLGTKVGLTVKDGGSGVDSIDMRIDGETEETLTLEEILAAGGTQTCGATSCELKYSFTSLLGEAREPGLHTVAIAVKDKAGHLTNLSHEVKLDTRPPELELSGPLAEAEGEPLPNETAALLAAATDGEGSFAAGLTSITVEVDGTKVLTERAGTGAPAGEERLWVADENNNRIQGFNSSGEVVASFGGTGSGPGQLNRPSSVAVDPKGNFWVADSNNHRIEQFDEEGSFVKAVGSFGTGNGQFSAPEGVAVDAKGNVWVADTYNARVQKLNEKGEFIQVVGTKGTGAGQLIEPTAIAFDSKGNAWVTDWSNNKVVVFNEAGAYVRQFGSSGGGNGQFAHPDTIAIDAKGNVWVGDQNNNRIQEFNQNGEYVTQFGVPGTGVGQFSFGYPMGIGTDAQGNLWVSDTGNNRVQRWNAANYSPTVTPTYSSTFGVLGSAAGQLNHPADVAIDAKGNLWVVDENNNRVQQYSTAGTYLAGYGSLGSGNVQFNRPTAIAIDSLGNLWITDAANRRVEVLSENGVFVRAFGSAGTGNGQFAGGGPEGIAIDSKGNVWVSDTYGARIQKFNQKGEFIQVVGTKGTGVGQMIEPTGIDIGPGGNVWVTDWSNNKVLEFSESGTFIREFGAAGTGNGQFSHPDALDVDTRGTIWVGDQSNARLQAFTETGEFLTKFGTAGTAAGQFQFGYPMGIAVDHKGAIWITDSNNNRMQKWVTPNYSPAYVSSFGSGGSGEGQFAHPAGIVAAAGHKCLTGECPFQMNAEYLYNETLWGTGPRSVVVTATDAAGNKDSEEVRVNEALNVVAPQCPTATPEALVAGTVRSPSQAVTAIQAALPDALAPSEAPEEEAAIEAAEEEGAEPTEPVIAPAVTREPEGVSLDEQGIDVVASAMGGGVEDEAAGSFTVGQAICMQPLQQGAAAQAPTVASGSAAVVYPNALPDTDTVVRPSALGTTLVEYRRGAKAPSEFKWKVGLEPGQELVKMSNGSIAVIAPSGVDSETEVPSEPPGGWGLDELNEVEAQLAEAEREMALANNQLTGEVHTVIGAPEVVLSSGEVVPGLLRITGGNVVVAELPPGTFAEAEALIIKANPAAKTEDICTFVLASQPQYYNSVCTTGIAGEAGEQPDPSETLTFVGATPHIGQPLRGRIVTAQQKFELLYGPSDLPPVAIWNGLTQEEKELCVKDHDIKRCVRMITAGAKAAEMEGKLFNVPDGAQNTKSNAFRHAFWTLAMEVAQDYDGFGMLWAEAHEGREYNNHDHPVRQKESQMDIMNDKVGWYNAGQYPKKTLTACTDMISKVGNAIHIGTEAYPYRWAKNHEWELFRFVYRKPRDFRFNEEDGVVVLRNGKTCKDVW